MLLFAVVCCSLLFGLIWLVRFGSVWFSLVFVWMHLPFGFVWFDLVWLVACLFAYLFGCGCSRVLCLLWLFHVVLCVCLFVCLFVCSFSFISVRLVCLVAWF